MTLAEIRDWLKTLEAAENYYIGRLENKKERSIGVYEGTAAGRPVMALGGLKNSSFLFLFQCHFFFTGTGIRTRLRQQPDLYGIS